MTTVQKPTRRNHCQGATYNAPCFYQGFKDENGHAVLLTLGIRFKSKAWKYIGAGVLAVATVGAAAGMVWAETNNSGSGYNNSYGSLSNSSSSNSSNATKTSSNSGGTTHTAAEVQAKNRDANTYSNYESQLIKMNTYWETQYNDSQRRSIQSNMKAIRQKWENKGFNMFHSQWEDWNGKKK